MTTMKLFIFDECVSQFARGRECIVQANDESHGESRCLHPHTNELDTNKFLDLDVDDTPQKWNSSHGTYSTFTLPVTNDQRGYTDDDFVLGCACLFSRFILFCPSSTHKSTTSWYGFKLDASRNLWEGSGLKVDSVVIDVGWGAGSGLYSSLSFLFICFGDPLSPKAHCLPSWPPCASSF